MSTFENLSMEKRFRIVDAAMAVFGQYGYSKASVSDIARRAGISKAMVFTYFGSKSGCYKYACGHMLEVAREEFEKHREEIFSISDFFERIKLFINIKADIFKRYPHLLSFSMSTYNERNEEVAPFIAQAFSQGLEIREAFLSADVDKARFKNPSDFGLVNKITRWLSLGCADEWSRSNGEEIDVALEEFSTCITLLKKQFYVEQ